MKQVIRKILAEYEYGGRFYIGETETHFLVTQIDREGFCDNSVYALDKKDWKIEE